MIIFESDPFISITLLPKRRATFKITNIQYHQSVSNMRILNASRGFGTKLSEDEIISG